MEFKRYSLNSRVITDLRKRSSIGLMFYIMAALVVVCAGDYYRRNTGFSILFVGSFMGICLFRGIYLLLHRRIEKHSRRLNIIIFISSVIATSFIWGAGMAFFMVQEGEHNAKLLMAICSTGLCSGGVVAFLPDRRLAVAYNILMLIPSAVFMALKGINCSPVDGYGEPLPILHGFQVPACPGLCVAKNKSKQCVELKPENRLLCPSGNLRFMDGEEVDSCESGN